MHAVKGTPLRSQLQEANAKDSISSKGPVTESNSKAVSVKEHPATETPNSDASASKPVELVSPKVAPAPSDEESNKTLEDSQSTIEIRFQAHSSKTLIDLENVPEDAQNRFTVNLNVDPDGRVLVEIPEVMASTHDLDKGVEQSLALDQLDTTKSLTVDLSEVQREHTGKAEGHAASKEVGTTTNEDKSGVEGLVPVDPKGKEDGQEHLIESSNMESSSQETKKSTLVPAQNSKTLDEQNSSLYQSKTLKPENMEASQEKNVSGQRDMAQINIQDDQYRDTGSYVGNEELSTFQQVVKKIDFASNQNPDLKTNEDVGLNNQKVSDGKKPSSVFDRTIDFWDKFKENDWLDASEIHSEIDKLFEDYEPDDYAIIELVKLSVHASLDKLLVQRMPNKAGEPGSFTKDFGSFLFQDEGFIKSWDAFLKWPALTTKKDLQENKIIFNIEKNRLNEWFKNFVAEAKALHKQKEYSNRLKNMLSPVFDKTPEEYSSEFKDEVKDLLVNEIIETQGEPKSGGLFWILEICKNLRLSIKNNNALKKEIILLAGKDLKLKTEIMESPLAQFESDKKQVVENFMKVLDTELPALFSTNGSLNPDSIRVYKKGG